VSSKLQRWTDVLVGLLRFRLGATFTELATDVPAYRLSENASDKEVATVKRMFERDKAELLALGIPIETVRRDEEVDAYRLRPADFYLPYLSIVAEQAARRSPRRLDKDGYRSVKELAFEPDELAAIADAAARVKQVGNALLSEHAGSGLRKLAFDLPQLEHASEQPVVLAGEQIDRALFPVLNQALIGRKTLTFSYHSIGRNTTDRRIVEPFGLFLLNSHWYLAARDPAGAVVKNFRLSRIRDATVNESRPQTADFEVPPTFNLRDHARSRQAWEIGDDDALDVIVEFVVPTGVTLPALALGTAVAGAPTHRAFRVRSLERFVRWTMSFAGAARPVSPPEFVEAYGAALRDVLSMYEGAR
jgi:predicted DNA-binding transcriptional regulator YafY